LLKRRLANNYPALIAGGVNSSFPSATSPIAKIFEIDVYSFGSTIILPFFAIFIPISFLKYYFHILMTLYQEIFL